MVTCTFEDGGTTSLRHVVVETLIIENNNILLVKRAAHLINPGLWAIPGGYVDRDETCKDAAIREAREETGYQIAIESLLEIEDRPDRPKEDRQNIVFAYRAKPMQKVDTHDSESTEMKWFSLDSLPPENEFAFDHYQRIQKFFL